MRADRAGFTLLEVLVALFVLALSMGALVSASRFHVTQVEEMRDRLIGSWVAHNRIVERRLSDIPPSPGTSSGSEKMLATSWQWEERVERTDEQLLLRLTVTAGLADGGSSRSVLTAYLGADQPRPKE